MGYSLRYFIAEDDGMLTRVPVARFHRWFANDEALPAARAGRELKLLEVVVEVDHHRVVDVLRILPFRGQVREDGRLDASAGMRLAFKRLDVLERVRTGDTLAQIEQLEADANYFWWPTDVQIRGLGVALLKRVPTAAELAEMLGVVWRPGDAPRER